MTSDKENKNMKKTKIPAIVVLSAVIAFCLCFAACGKKPAPAKDEISIAQSYYEYGGGDINITVKALDKDANISLKCGGNDVNASNYVLSGETLTLKNGYLKALLPGSYAFVISSDSGSAEFKVKIPEREAEKLPPVISPLKVEKDITDIGESVSFDVDLKGGTLSDILLGGEGLPNYAYQITPSGLVISGEYLKSLGEGLFEFVLETDGGSTGFEIHLYYNKLHSDAKVVNFTGDPIKISLHGTKDKTLGYYLNGVLQDPDLFRVADNELTVDAALFEPLKKDIYRLEIRSGGECVAVSVIGRGIDRYFWCDFDSAMPPSTGYGLGVVNETAEGESGLGGRAINKDMGTILAFNGGFIPFEFEAGRTYSFSFDMKPCRADAGTAIMNIAFPCYFKLPGKSYNADLGYIFYTVDKGWYGEGDKASKRMTMTKTDFGYHVYYEFEFKSEYGMFELDHWLHSDVIFDNLKIIPADGYMNFDLPVLDVAEVGSETDVTKDFGDVNILGVYVNGDFSASDKYTLGGGVVVFKAEFLKTIEVGGAVKYSVYTDKGRFDGTLSREYGISLEGDFGYKGEDLSFTLDSQDFELEKISLGDRVLGADEYALSEGSLTLKAAALDKIQSSAKLILDFSGNQSREYVISSYKILKADFDALPIDERGFGLNAGKTEITDGHDGKAGRVTIGDHAATMLAIGNERIPATFEPGKVYIFRMDIKIEDIDCGRNFIIEGSPVFMPVSFGPGHDVVYLKYTEEEKLTAETQSYGGEYTLTEKDGVYTFVTEVIVGKNMTELDFDVWMPCTLTVDNISLEEVI